MRTAPAQRRREEGSTTQKGRERSTHHTKGREGSMEAIELLKRENVAMSMVKITPPTPPSQALVQGHLTERVGHLEKTEKVRKSYKFWQQRNICTEASQWRRRRWIMQWPSIGHPWARVQRRLTSSPAVSESSSSVSL